MKTVTITLNGYSKKTKRFVRKKDFKKKSLTLQELAQRFNGVTQKNTLIFFSPKDFNNCLSYLFNNEIYFFNNINRQ